MRIGVVSDTHDHLDRLRRALEVCRKEGAALVLHAGDFISPFTAVPFVETGLSLIGVFGNNDGDVRHLQERFRGCGELHAGPHELGLAGRRVVLMHEPRTLDALIDSGRYDLVVYGHTHRVDVRGGFPRVVNPGECCGWITGRATCAVVDLSTLETQIFDLGQP
ncbi:MAG: hypothetical protein BIP78_0542 [Candidatus Bipolaricaulis sibiricus]|uniref:Phosphoesterase n=1 Tax=Bipolaricaulis sibiricus TaxID=2501609 RepID=A0A410FTP9_BIPS1|nr:MAG: hypothetical protein BIP78_0542 [Candidatus Bipolaricaulis sibiricus]